MPRLVISLLPILLILGPKLTSAQDLSLEEAKQAFANADATLNSVYEEAKETVASYRFTKIEKEQRDWIAYRDHRAAGAAHFDGRANSGEETTNAEYWKAMAYLTETRIEILNAWMKVDTFTKTWEGAWIDGYGGILRIVENPDGTFTFACSVVRGPTYHLGNIDGTAAANQTTARFTTQVDKDSAETWLTFLLEGDGRLRVIGENTQFFHGARAYFDGSYLRVRELTEEDRSEM
jgi:uncharacterized protein YecT (DUF1311 family)